MGEDWMLLAACRGRTQDMFPTTESGHAVAISICATCTVATECLDYALLFPPGDMYGVWAGMDARALMKEQILQGKQPKKASYRQTVTLTDSD